MTIGTGRRLVWAKHNDHPTPSAGKTQQRCPHFHSHSSPPRLFIPKCWLAAHADGAICAAEVKGQELPLIDGKLELTCPKSHTPTGNMFAQSRRGGGILGGDVTEAEPSLGGREQRSGTTNASESDRGSGVTGVRGSTTSPSVDLGIPGWRSVADRSNPWDHGRPGRKCGAPQSRPKVRRLCTRRIK